MSKTLNGQNPKCRYNADIGLYVVNSNRWMVPREDIHVMHYTLGANLKPWNWWTGWVTPLHLTRPAACRHPAPFFESWIETFKHVYFYLSCPDGGCAAR